MFQYIKSLFWKVEPTEQFVVYELETEQELCKNLNTNSLSTKNKIFEKKSNDDLEFNSEIIKDNKIINLNNYKLKKRNRKIKSKFY